MSSDLYVVDGSFYLHSSPEMVSSDGDLFFPDNYPFSPFGDSHIDILHEPPNNNQNIQYNFSPFILSSSPPSHQLENLTLHQTTQPQEHDPNLGNCVSLPDEYGTFSDLESLEVKIEECKVSIDSPYNHDSFLPHSYSGVENVEKMIQRSYSSNSFDGKPGFLFQPYFDTLLESPNYQNQALTSPENSFLAGHLRRVFSTGDLQNLRTAHAAQRSFSSSQASESSFTEEANFKIGRYSAEERKERISKYRAKRNQRNFTKTIKYACRKTLADNRPRVRGRFARNDEIGEIPKAGCSTRDEEEEGLWFAGMHEEEDELSTARGAGGAADGSCFGQPQFQYY